MTEPNPAHPPARNMADIARMFLDGARPLPEAGTPKRLSPKDRHSQTAPTTASPSALPTVLLAILAPETSPASAAHRLAHLHQTSIGILTLQNHSFTLDLAGPAPANLPPIAPSAGAPDMQIARILFTLRHSLHHWIIAAPPADSPAFPRLAAALADWLLITPADNDHVVAAYQELKRAIALSLPAHDPIAVLLSSDPTNAAAVHARLRRAAAGFLKKDLPLAAVAPLSATTPLRLANIPIAPADHPAIYAALLDELCGMSSEIEPETTTESDTPLASDFEDEIIEAPTPRPAQSPTPSFDDSARHHSIDIDEPLDSLTAAAVDLALHADHSAAAHTALFDHLTNVLDPDEREALNAELFALPAPPPAEARSTGFSLPENQPKSHTPNPAPEIPLSPPPIETRKSKIENPTILHALDLPAATDRPSQWQAVEASIPSLLPNIILLDARPPMPWAAQSCLAVDPAGGLHIWTLGHPAASWFALREWAAEHLDLLALTRRELLVKSDRPITTHLILPLDSDAQSDPAPLLRTAPPNLRLYRLHNLQWHAQRGLVVVPLH